MRQISKNQRRLAAGAFLIIAAPIVATSVAYACQSLATLHANPRSTTAGSTVLLRGTNYSSGASNSNIEIRLDGRTGRLLASLTPRSSLVDVPVVIPADVAAGTHTLLATQFTSSGNAVSGTPGRASLVLTVAARTSSDASGAGGGATSTASTDSGAAAPAATPAVVAPAVPAASTPAPAVPGAATANQVVAPTPAAAAASNSVAVPATAEGTTPGAPAASTAAPAVAPAAAEPTASAAGPASVNVGLLPASASDSSSLPGLAMAAGLALVLLALGAFIKTGRNVLGRGTTPLAG
jgi:hypothetical protein